MGAEIRAGSGVAGEPSAATGALGSVAGMFSRILVPVDGSEHVKRAVDTAVRLAQRDGAELALLAVVDLRLTYVAEAGILPADLIASLRREAGTFLLNGNLYLPPELHAVDLLREGEPARAIVAAAREWGADLIVLGHAASAGVGRLFADHTAEAVAQRAPCPVLVVQPEEPPGGVGGWRRMLRWARLRDEPGCPGEATA
jgi:nucleotide-binding universal stress UspA family protein